MCICLHSRYIHMFGGVCTTHTDRYIRGRKKKRERILMFNHCWDSLASHLKLMNPTDMHKSYRYKYVGQISSYKRVK